MKFGNLVSQFMIVMLLLGLAACATTVQETDYEMRSRALPGAVIGGTAGVAIGAAAHGNVPLAIASGVVVGSILGYLSEKEWALVSILQREGVQVIAPGEYLVLVIPSDQFFDIHSDRIRPETYGILRDVVRLLREVDQSRVVIEAYTDNIGPPLYKRELSQQQAERMRSFFWAHGIDFRRLSAIGYGQDYPIANNRTAFGSAMNRRIEIRLAKTKDLVV